MSFVACHEANKEKLCVECINYVRCKDREWRSCFSREKEYWNQVIFVDELVESYMVKAITKTPRNIGWFRNHRPKCQQCGKDLYEHMLQKGTTVWRRGVGRTPIRSRYYCDDCKKDLFEGVKLRDGFSDDEDRPSNVEKKGD